MYPVPDLASETPMLPSSAPGMALVLQVGSGRGSDTFTQSYLLKRQVHRLRVQLERVAYKGQARRPWREVFWTPPFEEISKEEKSGSPQEESARTESRPEGRRQGAQYLQHGCGVLSLFCALSGKSPRGSVPLGSQLPGAPRPRPTLQSHPALPSSHHYSSFPQQSPKPHPGLPGEAGPPYPSLPFLRPCLLLPSLQLPPT